MFPLVMQMTSVEHFTYLGAYCSTDGTITKELNYRKGKVAGAFREHDSIWKDWYTVFLRKCITCIMLVSCQHCYIGRNTGAQEMSNKNSQGQVVTAYIRNLCRKWTTHDSNSDCTDGNQPMTKVDPVITPHTPWKGIIRRDIDTIYSLDGLLRRPR